MCVSFDICEAIFKAGCLFLRNIDKYPPHIYMCHISLSFFAEYESETFIVVNDYFTTLKIVSEISHLHALQSSELIWITW
jgi:hypothetical protein